MITRWIVLHWFKKKLQQNWSQANITPALKQAYIEQKEEISRILKQTTYFIEKIKLADMTYLEVPYHQVAKVKNI